MPWSGDHYRSPMLHLSQVARPKAIEIAKALLADGMDERRAIRIAIARAAEQWVQRRGLAAREVG